MNTLCSIVILAALVAFAGASILAAPGIIAPGLAIGGPLGLGLGLGGIAGPLALGVGPLGVRVTARNLRVAPAGAPIGVLVPAGSGLEGQWVPEISEKLHDDGSFKPEIYGA